MKTRVAMILLVLLTSTAVASADEDRLSEFEGLDGQQYHFQDRCVFELMGYMNAAKFWREYEKKAYISCYNVPNVAALQLHPNHVLYTVKTTRGQKTFLLEKGEYFKNVTFGIGEPLFRGLYAARGAKMITTFAGVQKTIPVLKIVWGQDELRAWDAEVRERNAAAKGKVK